MSTRDRRTDYYSRLPDCPQCKAAQGQRCTGKDGSVLVDPHGSRVLASQTHTAETVGKMLVECPTCGSGVGVSCRSKPYNTRLSRPHAARRKALEEAQS